MKKIGSMMLALLMALALAQGAWAEVKTWEHQEEEMTLFFRFTTWDSELPQALQKPLKEAGYGTLPCLSGAMWEVVRKGTNKVESITALVALEGASGPVAIGMVYGADTREWALDDMGNKAFLPGEAFTIQAFVGEHPMWPSLMVEYAASGGGVARYELRSGDGFRRPWSVYGYTFQDATGQGIQIVCDYPEYGFRVRPFPKTDDRGTYYPAFTPMLVRYMKGGVADYPTSEVEAREISQAAQVPFEVQKLALLVGANLREKATGRSKSLGFCQSGALAQVLGQEKGKDFPWVHLRLGDVEGYVSGIYVKQVGGYGFLPGAVQNAAPSGEGQEELRAAGDGGQECEGGFPAACGHADACAVRDL